jgi:phage-related protein
MAEDIYMEVPKVTQMGQTFSTISDTCNTVHTILEGIANAIKASGIFGAICGLTIVAEVIDMINPVIKQVGDLCSTVSEGIKGAVSSYVNGDQSGSALFR